MKIKSSIKSWVWDHLFLYHASPDVKSMTCVTLSLWKWRYIRLFYFDPTTRFGSKIYRTLSRWCDTGY